MDKPILNKKGFSKRTYRLKDFLYDLMTLLYSCPCLIRAAHEKTIEPVQYIIAKVRGGPKKNHGKDF